jgi:hypothetical protein
MPAKTEASVGPVDKIEGKSGSGRLAAGGFPSLLRLGGEQQRIAISDSIRTERL